MPPLFQLSSSKQAALDAISPSFHLSESKLHEITKRFLDEFAIGVTAYNNPMAMIRKHLSSSFSYFVCSLRIAYSNLRHRDSKWCRKGVSLRCRRGSGATLTFRVPPQQNFPCLGSRRNKSVGPPHIKSTSLSSRIPAASAKLHSGETTPFLCARPSTRSQRL